MITGPTINRREAQHLAVGIKRAAQLLSVSPATIYVKIHDGSLPAYKCGGRTLILLSDIEKLLGSLPPFTPRTRAIRLNRRPDA